MADNATSISNFGTGGCSGSDGRYTGTDFRLIFCIEGSWTVISRTDAAFSVGDVGVFSHDELETGGVQA